MPAIVTAIPSTDTVTTQAGSLLDDVTLGVRERRSASTSHTGRRLSTVSPHVPAGPGERVQVAGSGRIAVGHEHGLVDAAPGLLGDLVDVAARPVRAPRFLQHEHVGIERQTRGGDVERPAAAVDAPVGVEAGDGELGHGGLCRLPAHGESSRNAAAVTPPGAATTASSYRGRAPRVGLPPRPDPGAGTSRGAADLGHQTTRRTYAGYDLTGQVAVLTGAGSGIGKATALTLAGAGATIVGGDIDEAAVQGDRRRDHGRAAEPRVPCRPTSRRAAQVDALVDGAQAEFGRVDIMGNIAGVPHNKMVMEVTDDEFERILSINLKSCVYGCQAAMRVMAPQESGNIINISSGAIDTPAPTLACYGMTKAAVAMLDEDPRLRGRSARDPGRTRSRPA